MAKKTGKKMSALFKRDLIQKNEGRLTYVQLAGFTLILLGLVYMASFLLPSGVIKYAAWMELDDAPTPYGISIAFFTIMLGVSFAFPQMLQTGQGETSTMRIVVFMLVNVMCMLLLKVGWGKNNLSEIGLDENWVAIIAFLFGAKATQAYFENKASREKEGDRSTSTGAQIARHFEHEKMSWLKSKYPNIVSVSATVNKEGQDVLAVYLKDSDAALIPAELSDTVNGREVKIKTQVIPGAGPAVPHLGQATDELSDSNTPNYLGSICCLVDSTVNPAFKGLVTSGHVFTYGDFFDYGGILGPANRRSVLLNGKAFGKLFFQQMRYNQDLAIVELPANGNLLQNYISFKAGFYKLSNDDLRTSVPNVALAARGNKIQEAYVLDFNVSFEVNYYNGPQLVRNIILIGTTNDPATSAPVSTGGDSGGCVYHKESEKLIGMLLGGNTRFSFVLPLEDTLNAYNFKIL